MSVYLSLLKNGLKLECLKYFLNLLQTISDHVLIILKKERKETIFKIQQYDKQHYLPI